MKAYITILNNEVALVPYFVKHYRSLGATGFPTMVYGETDLEALAKSVGEGFDLRREYPSEIFSASHRDRTLRKMHRQEHPKGEWAFFCDLDEFAQLTREDVERFKATEGLAFVWATWCDRCGPGGKLVEIDPQKTLHEQFPWRCRKSIRKQVDVGGKVFVLSRIGPKIHHPSNVLIGRWPNVQIKTHHFKWQTNVIERIEWRVRWIEEHRPRAKGWAGRNRRLLNYLKHHGGLNPHYCEPCPIDLGV